jgi:hypothetical protein
MATLAPAAPAMPVLTAAQLAQFDELGWLLLPSAVSADLLPPLTAAARTVAAAARTDWPHGGWRQHSAGVWGVGNLIHADRGADAEVFAQYLARTVGLVAQLLGGVEIDEGGTVILECYKLSSTGISFSLHKSARSRGEA